MDRRVYDNYVLQVAEQGSLTKAAAALGISQPALSSGLTGLEKDVGIKIFNRRSVPVTFTEEGLAYYEYIRRLRVLSDDFAQRLAAMREDAKNRVVIGGPSAYAESIVTDAVIALKASHPEYQVQIRTSSLPDLIDAASAGRLSCFISTSDALPDNFEKQLIKTELVYLVIPRADPLNSALAAYAVHPGQAGDLFDYSLLSGHDFIFLEEGQPLQKKVSSFLRDSSIHPAGSIVVDQVSTAVSLSLKGAGICFASEAALSGSLNLDKVCIYSLPSAVSGRKIYAAYDRDLLMTDACRHLISLLVSGNRNN